MPYVAVTALSHPGLLRERNEDSLVAGPWTLCATVTESPQTLMFPFGSPVVVAVADGLGGHPGGDVASALVARRIAACGASMSDEEAVHDVLDACNRAVYRAADDTGGGLAAMGTTVAGVVVRPDSLLVFNVGDSRVLAAGPDGLRQLSTDDSPALEPGCRTTPVVTQCLGGNTAYTPVVPHITTTPLVPGTRYLICTDGLTDPVPPETLRQLLHDHQDDHIAFELWKAAITAGGPDNITVAVVRVVGE
ncbi:serine/threonine-protein phosphatase [Streptomyces sp. J2-1]|uniref:PP2C family protein-serine/threonine phosphatase n=1 Tax=Streptomyces corallincola TaxID=2851888 RepID=UPI001C3940A4|nr:PP2C family serine/threonine-protein phosphatase [Streptomyces corallincola]MBV2357762.1 serine/threonine-protein phosphatase [Streptomyces corallincola]